MDKKFSNILIEKTASLKEAMKRIDSIDEKIVFVVDEKEKLIGSLTDGDVRRWILKDGKLDVSVETACFKKTYCASPGYDVEAVKEEMKKREIQYVPVIAKEGTIIDILVWQDLFNKSFAVKRGSLDATVVIMAGGQGTRLDPFTRILPKPLIPIGNRTILEIIIEKFLEYGIRTFYLSLHHKARIIKSYFEELKPEYTLIFLDEEKPLGTIGALKQLKGKAKGEILLTNCDIIIETDYSDLLKHHRKEKNDLTLVASVKHYNIPYGICETKDGGTLTAIREKPEYDFLVNTGMYILDPGLLMYIPHNTFFNATDLVEAVIAAGKKVGIYPISENSWIDTGEWVEYKKAVEKLQI